MPLVFPQCQDALDGTKPGTDIVKCRLCKRTHAAVAVSHCLRCQRPTKPTKPIIPKSVRVQIAPPRAKQIEAPPLIIRLKTWVEALEQWDAAGNPVRSQSQIDDIYKTHCKPCSFRRKTENICLVCGCRIATYGFAIFNKIKMATEHCPKGKW